MPAELGGGGLDSFGVTLVDREFGAASYALHYIVARPSNILRACTGDQIDEYLLPTITGERVDCMAMSEPDAGSDVRGMKCSAVRDGDDYVINGTKHFISHADLADYVILFAASGEEQTSRGPKKLITGFLVDFDTPGCDVVDGYSCVSNRGYHNMIINFDDCRGAGVEDPRRGASRLRRGQRVARLDPAAGRRGLRRPGPAGARHRHRMGRDPGAVRPADRQVPGRVVQAGRHADPARGRRAADAARRLEGRRRATATDSDMAIAKVFASEMCQFVTDEAIQILGGMGLMDELPLERMWRDTRVDRIWDGTSEIQRHIISRAMLRPFGA